MADLAHDASFGRDGLDRGLIKHVLGRGGFFIEAGAYDGLTESNTALLERDRDWTGLLIEPIPRLVEQCRRNRPGCLVEQAALVPLEYPEEVVTMTFAESWSAVRGAWGDSEADRAFAEAGRAMARENHEDFEICEELVPARPLSAILDSHSITRVDLLSLDVEGNELSALQGLDMQRHRPSFLLIEVWDEKRDELEAYIQRWYEPVAELGRGRTGDKYESDVLYRSRSGEVSPAGHEHLLTDVKA